MPAVPQRQRKHLGLFVLATLVLFCLSMALSAALYPGGTWFDPTTVGHSFWGNFWCDLLRARAHDGAPNVAGSRIALAGWLVLSVGMAAFWILVPDAMDDTPRLASWVRRLGLLSAIAMVGVFVTPSDHFPKLHGITITAAGGPGLVALGLAVWSLGRRGRPLGLRVAGWAVTTFATANFVIYSQEYWLHLPGSPVLPPIQKLATLSAVAWIALVVQSAWTKNRSERGASER